MINLHAATSVAKDLGLDLVDIYGIHKWIQMQASPLNDLDIVREMVRNLLVKEFEKHLKINRLWYNCCKAELWKRHKEAEDAYDRAVKKKEKAGMILVSHLRRRVLEIVNFMSLIGRHIKRLVKSYRKLEKSIVW